MYPSGVDVSSSALRFLSAKLRQRRQELGTRWRRLSVGRQALLTLAHLRNGHPYAQLAAGLGIGTTTAHRCITEAVEVLAALAPTLAEVVRTASSKAFVLLDGTLPIDRISADRPQAVNRSHAKIRALVEQAMATLKSWRLLRKLRCSTTRIASLVQAILTLHLTSSDR
ncbi:transposase family protein [Streptomyces ardesiacus]|uniref:transposase family protein n=1 Tax=Streptomyces ardesiacus TaxID=285564 RepID=UPI000D59A515|nr:transposase family protein [Streptomyces ardesiacus]